MANSETNMAPNQTALEPTSQSQDQRSTNQPGESNSLLDKSRDSSVLHKSVISEERTDNTGRKSVTNQVSEGLSEVTNATAVGGGSSRTNSRTSHQHSDQSEREKLLP